MVNEKLISPTLNQHANNTFSIHTLTLFFNLTNHEYDKTFNLLSNYCYTHNIGHYKNPNSTTTNTFSTFKVYKENGFNNFSLVIYNTLAYTTYGLTFTVNLRRLFKIQTYPFICIAPNELLCNTFSEIDYYLKSLGIDHLKAEDSTIKRLDLCTNFACNTLKEKELMMFLLKKGRYIFNSQRATEYSNSSHRDIPTKNSFTLIGNTFEFSAYDKYKQLFESKYDYSQDELDLAQLQIRIEIRLDGRRINYLKKHGHYYILNDISEIGYKKYKSFIKNIYGLGDFYQYSHTARIINESSYSLSTKEQMIEIIKKTSKTNLELGLQTIKKKDQSKYLNKFNHLNISPITIPRTIDIAFCHNPWSYIINNNVNERLIN